MADGRAVAKLNGLCEAAAEIGYQVERECRIQEG